MRLITSTWNPAIFPWKRNVINQKVFRNSPPAPCQTRERRVKNDKAGMSRRRSPVFVHILGFKFELYYIYILYIKVLYKI